MTKHDKVAARLAKELRTTYNRGQGPDIVTSELAIEVETKKSLQKDGLRQLQGFRKAVYVAMTDDADIPYALNMTNGTTVGVVDRNGRIVDSSSRAG